MSQLGLLVRGVLRSRPGYIGAVMIAGATLFALLAPVLSPFGPVRVDLEQKLLAPSSTHLMGTDQAGRDIFSRVIWGARVSLQVGVLAVIIGLAGGVILGMLAGFYNGTWLEQLIMR